MPGVSVRLIGQKDRETCVSSLALDAFKCWGERAGSLQSSRLLCRPERTRECGQMYILTGRWKEETRLHELVDVAVIFASVVRRTLRLESYR